MADKGRNVTITNGFSVMRLLELIYKCFVDRQIWIKTL